MSQNEIRISQINIYPIKSCAGTSLTRAKVGLRGLENDRRWMVVDRNDMFITQRQYQRMALIRPLLPDASSPDDVLITLSAPGMTDFVLRKNFGERILPRFVQVWDDVCEAVDQGDEVATWLSTFLDVTCRLVEMENGFARKVDPLYAVADEDQVSFADGYPLLIISKASLDDLNSRLETPLLMNRFRPNLVAIGCSAYEEDTWREIRIGSVDFAAVKPCARCTITTVDQATAEKGVEPLRTLATYRRSLQGVLFGQNLIQRSQGEIELHDLVQIKQLAAKV